MENPYQMSGKRIRFFREQDGLTQAELAEKTGLSDNFIGLIERGIKHPTLETLNKIAEALEVRLGEFFQPMTNRPEDAEGASKELKRLLSKRNFKDAKLLLAIYKAICEHPRLKAKNKIIFKT